jgi:hypothetical protein
MSAAAGVAASVIVTPREAFTHNVRCFARLLECTPAPHRIVYVDGASPGAVAREVARLCARHDVALLRTECVVTPNHARNLALAQLPVADDPPWTAFVDNDAYVNPGWLDGLRACGDDTGAVAVAPLLCIGEPGRADVHVAGGTADIDDHDGVRRFSESHVHGGDALTPLRETLTRQPCTMFEFHAVLVRSTALRAAVPLDEELRSLLEHIDLSFELRAAGGEIWFEPAVEITYIPGVARRVDDRRYFVSRWSDEWNRSSAARFCEKWDLPADDAGIVDTVEFGAWMRARAYRPFRSPFVRWSARHHRYPRSLVDRVAQRDALRWYRRQVATSAPPRLAHQPSWWEPVDA